MSEPNQWRNMILNAPSLESELCPFCGAPATNRHHIAPKGMGGRREAGPTVCVCGNGNTSGCHKRFHDGKIFMRYIGNHRQGCWEYVEFKKPTSLTEVISREELLEWKRVKGVDRYGIPLSGKAQLNG